MPSEFAKRLSQEMPDASFIGRSLLRDYVPRQRMIDAELQEVREVLKLVAHPKFDAGGDGIHYYVTKADIERARALMLKLEVRP